MYQFAKPSRPVTKVFIHCSASDNPAHDNVATIDAWHKARGWSGVGYHLFGRKNGDGEVGRSLEKSPAAQGGHNRGSIAICLHGLNESKFTKAQKHWLIGVCAQINQAYGGAVTFHGHREVAAKECPVIDYSSILKLDDDGRLGLTEGDIKAAGQPKLVDIGDLSGLEDAEAGSMIHRPVRLGDRGGSVRWMQQRLKELGYHSGALDGHFGSITRASVLAFQADNHLIEDGIAGPATFEALADAEARAVSAERASKTVVGLASDGSRIAQASVAQGVLGGLLSAGGGIAVIDQITGFVSQIAASAGTLHGIFNEHGSWVAAAVAVAGVLVVVNAVKAGRARQEDHRTARTL